MLGLDIFVRISCSSWQFFYEKKLRCIWNWYKDSSVPHYYGNKTSARMEVQNHILARGLQSPPEGQQRFRATYKLYYAPTWKTVYDIHTKFM